MNGWCGGRQGLFGWGSRRIPEVSLSQSGALGWYTVFLQNTGGGGGGGPRAMLWAGIRCPVGTRGSRADQRRGREGSGVSDGKGGTRGSRADQRRGCVGTRGGGFGARGWGAVAVAGDGEGVGELGSVPDVVFVIVDSVFLQEVAVFVLKGPCLVVFFLGVDVVEQGFLLAHSHGEGSIAELP